MACRIEQRVGLPSRSSRAIFIFLPAKVIGVPHRGEHRQAPERAAADIEGHSKAVKYGHGTIASSFFHSGALSNRW
jgi:hypothetical protein